MRSKFFGFYFEIEMALPYNGRNYHISLGIRQIFFLPKQSQKSLALLEEGSSLDLWDCLGRVKLI